MFVAGKHDDLVSECSEIAKDFRGACCSDGIEVYQDIVEDERQCSPTSGVGSGEGESQGDEDGFAGSST
jgi:hypothetical protein